MKEQILKRLRNKAFLLALASGIVLLAQQLGLDIFPSNIADIINTILALLTIGGVIIDPSTSGLTDRD